MLLQRHRSSSVNAVSSVVTVIIEQGLTVNFSGSSPTKAPVTSLIRVFSYIPPTDGPHDSITLSVLPRKLSSERLTE